MVTEKIVTTIFLTYDQIDALALADKIAVMKDDRIQQFICRWTPINIFILELKYIDENIILGNECLTLNSPKPIFVKIKSNLDNNTNEVILGIRPQSCFVLSNY